MTPPPEPEALRADLSEQRGAILTFMVDLEEELKRNERLLTTLNEIKHAGRWAAFTTPELEDVAEAIECTFGDHPESPYRPMLDEITAELERRQA